MSIATHSISAATPLRLSRDANIFSASSPLPRETFRTRPVSRSRTTVMNCRPPRSSWNTYTSSMPMRLTPLSGTHLYFSSSARISASRTTWRETPRSSATSVMDILRRFSTISFSSARVMRALGFVRNSRCSYDIDRHSGQ